MEIFNETMPALNKIMSDLNLPTQETNQTEILKEEIENDLLEAQLQVAQFSNFLYTIKEKLAKI